MSIVLITGCRSGIGLETAVVFGRRGDTVCATMRDPSRGERLRDIASNESLNIEIQALDVTDHDAITSVVAGLVARHGRIDVLVNNAGVGGVASAVEEIDEADARSVVETNLWAPFRLSRAVLPIMRAQGAGVIVNVSSVTTRFEGQPGLAPYGMSKIALSHLSESMNAELEGTGVRVIAVEPGPFATDIYPANRLNPTTGSHYTDLVTDVDHAIANLIAAAQDPAIAARAIVDYVTDTSTTGRVLIGDEAAQAVTAYQQELMSTWQTPTER